MGWATWMQIKPSTEELFEIERSVRNVQNCTDEDQSKLLSQAVGRIGELDAKLACWD